jgi:transposase
VIRSSLGEHKAISVGLKQLVVPLRAQLMDPTDISIMTLFPTEPHKIAFFDESGVEFEKTNRKNSGWGHRSRRIVSRKYFSQKGKHFNLLVLADVRCSVNHFELFPGSCNAEKIIEFFSHVKERLEISEIEFIQMDGARTHGHALAQFLSGVTNIYGTPITLVIQPPYSPYLNPVEALFGVVKSRMKTDSDPARTYDALRPQVEKSFSHINPSLMISFLQYAHFSRLSLIDEKVLVGRTDL